MPGMKDDSRKHPQGKGGVHCRILRLMVYGLLQSLPMICLSQSAPVIQSLQNGAGDTAVITGRGFGSRCRQCEVIVEYPDGLQYSARIKSWAARQIRFHARDFNKGTHVHVHAQASGSGSNSIAYTIRPVRHPRKRVSRFIPQGVMKDLLVFSRQSRNAAGAKGVDAHNVSGRAPGCGQKALVFDHAVLLQKGRYGQARVLSQPRTGCVQCQPIRIKWYQEPTGSLAYQLHVYRREIWGICPDRVR